MVAVKKFFVEKRWALVAILSVFFGVLVLQYCV